MSTKRQPSKQRRQSQNRQQRAALEARRAAVAAGEAPTSKVGGSPPTSGGSVLSRLTATGSSSRRTRSAQGRSRAAGLPVGHRSALTSVMLAAASVLFVVFGFRVPISTATGEAIATKPERVAEWSLAALDAARELGAEATANDVRDAVEVWSPGGKESYLTAFWPYSPSVFLPVLGAALGFRAVRKRASARLINRTMYITLFGALLTRELLIFFLPAVVAMAIAAFQVRKAEVAEAPTAREDVTEEDVIDVDSVIEDEPTS